MTSFLEISIVLVFILNDVSETGLCLRPQVEAYSLGHKKGFSYLRTQSSAPETLLQIKIRTMNSVHKTDHCIKFHENTFRGF
jgi:hypothetical protein